MEHTLTKYLGENYIYQTENNDNTEEIKNLDIKKLNEHNLIR